jgi:hypothetical protein
MMIRMMMMMIRMMMMIEEKPKQTQPLGWYLHTARHASNQPTSKTGCHTNKQPAITKYDCRHA